MRVVLHRPGLTRGTRCLIIAVRELDQRRRVIVLARLSHSEGAVPLIGRSLLGIAALITGVLLAAPELVRWAVSPISHLLDSILLPSETIPCVRRGKRRACSWSQSLPPRV